MQKVRTPECWTIIVMPRFCKHTENQTLVYTTLNRRICFTLHCRMQTLALRYTVVATSVSHIWRWSPKCSSRHLNTWPSRQYSIEGDHIKAPVRNNKQKKSRQAFCSQRTWKVELKPIVLAGQWRCVNICLGEVHELFPCYALTVTLVMSTVAHKPVIHLYGCS